MTRRDAVTMARLAADSAWSGVVKPRSTSKPFVPRNATSIDMVAQRVGGPLAHGGTRAAAHATAQHHEFDAGHVGKPRGDRESSWSPR